MQIPVAPPTYESEIWDHLGLVAGMYDELEIGDQIDARLSQDLVRREVSVGQAVESWCSMACDLSSNPFI